MKVFILFECVLAVHLSKIKYACDVADLLIVNGMPLKPLSHKATILGEDIYVVYSVTMFSIQIGSYLMDLLGQA